MGYLKQFVEYQTLSITRKGLDVLDGLSPVMGILLDAKERVKKSEKKKSEIEYNSALFALLRQKRKELADRAGVPPYVIFSDRSLIEMAAYYPQSTASLLSIAGVGQAKSSRYGREFLAVIQDFCKKHALSERSPEQSQRAGGKAKPAQEEIGERTRLIAETFNQGVSIKILMDRHQVTRGTILDHLTRYALAGHSLHDWEELHAMISVAADQKQAALAAFDELGPVLLKPVYDKLNGALNYDDLRILRLIYLTGK